MKLIKSKKCMFLALFTLCLCSKPIFGGFEIGNALKVIENVPGRYSITVPHKSEVGTVRNFTEVIAPLTEGTPRTRLQVNVVNEERMKTVVDLIDSKQDESWTPISLSGLQGIKKEMTVSTGLRQVEVRLFLRPSKVVVVTLEGVPSPSPLSSFEMLKDSIETLKVGP